MKHVCIRTDASTQIGSGHIGRCLSLAQALKDVGIPSIFVTAVQPPTLNPRLKAEGMQIIQISTPLGSLEDAKRTAYLSRQMGSNWVIVDGYGFNGNYQKVIKDNGLNLLTIDDYGQAGHYFADIVLNQNCYAVEDLYSDREPYTELLLGTKYTLLRREFLEMKNLVRNVPEQARKLLISMGGGDPANVSLKVIRALDRVETENLEVIVVVGENNPHYRELKYALRELKTSIRLMRNVTHMAELMAWSDLAVSGGGSTCWELVFMQLPFLILVLAENQRRIAEELNRLGAAVNLKQHENISSQEISDAITKLLSDKRTRVRMIQRARELIDGSGSNRVLNRMGIKCSS